MRKNHTNTMSHKGFTLIEILIVVAIIAILSSVVLVGLGPTQQSGRDARRLSDLREIQTGLELYFSKCGFYPGGANCAPGAASGYGAMSTALTGSAIGVTTVPNDPTANRQYFYRTGNGETTYVLGAKLENPNNSVYINYNPPQLSAYADGGDTSAVFPNCTTSTAASYYCVSL